MSASVCVFCGQIKQGAVTPCAACARTPLSEINLAYSFALSTNYQTPETIREISAEMQRGCPRPELPSDDEQYMRQVARQWMGNPLYQAVVANNKANDKGERYSISPSGTVEGAFIARDCSIQIARHARDPIAVSRQMSVHAFKHLGTFTSSEWKILAEAARDQSWIERRGVRDRYAHLYTDPNNREELFLKTAIAEEYGYSDAATYHDSKRPELAIFKLIDDGDMKLRCDRQRGQNGR